MKTTKEEQALQALRKELLDKQTVLSAIEREVPTCPLHPPSPTFQSAIQKSEYTEKMEDFQRKSDKNNERINLARQQNQAINNERKELAVKIKHVQQKQTDALDKINTS